MSLLPVAEAQARLLALAAPLAEEAVPLVEAAGRYAAQEVRALRTQPEADLSAMDGYALRFADLPGPLTLVGESRAGTALDRPIGAGEAARIFTGAPLPEGADTILVQEEAAAAGRQVRLDGEGPPHIGAHVRALGSDFTAGSVLIAGGAPITAARIGLAAVGGHGTLPVRRRARVALLSTGDELAAPGARLAAGRLPASNAAMLQALIGDRATVADQGIAPDRIDAIAGMLGEAAAGADIVVTTGGASVGDHDLVRPALEQIGARIDFWRVAMRPGKPLMVGLHGTTIMLGLPGNPVSALVTARLFLLPLLARLGGAADPRPRSEEMPLIRALEAGGSRDAYLRATIEPEGVRPLVEQDSAGLTALAQADALVRRAAGVAAAPVGTRVEVIRLY